MSISVSDESGELVIRVKVDAEPSDQLIPIAREPLEKLGLEYRPVLRLADEGALKTVSIGRRRFTKLSYLLALVDALPAAKAEEEEAVDDLVIAARKRAAKQAR